MDNLKVEDCIDPEGCPIDMYDLKGAGWLVGQFAAFAQLLGMAYATAKGYPEVLAIPFVTNAVSWLYENARYRRTGKHYDTEGLNR